MDNAELLKKFSLHVKKYQLFTNEDRLLLAVSGGIDSVFMAWLFKLSGLSFAIAHCNFMLRGSESVEDERFVASWAVYNQVGFVTREFDTAGYALKHGVSIQMAARELRYRWFDDLVKSGAYSRVALGHHLGDNTETMLINLVRGTGISGLHGIRELNDYLIRPLLFLDRRQIEDFVAANKLTFREDSSNAESHYLRNFLRLDIILGLKTLNPSLDQTFSDTAKRLRTVEKFYREKCELLKERIVSQDAGVTQFAIKALVELKEDAVNLIYEWLGLFGFTFGTCEAIAENLGAASGTAYYSSTHRLVFDRLVFRVEPLLSDSESEKLNASLVMCNYFELKLMPNEPGAYTLPYPAGGTTAVLNGDELEFPLKVRFWRNGDSFVPLGGMGHKKLSDLFIDLKIPLSEKSRIPLLISGSTIVWVAGLRIHDQFKYKPTCNWVAVVDLKVPADRPGAQN